MSSSPDCAEYRSASSGSEESEGISASVRRSRKRFLSPGLLRGELVADRLREQEASASPLLKKNKPCNMSSFSWTDFTNYMTNNVTKRFDTLESGQQGLQADVRRVESKVQANADKIDQHEKLIRENQAGLSEMKREIGQLRISAPGRPSTDSSSPSWRHPRPTAPVPMEEYARARRSLRFWPVEGNSAEQVWRSTGEFLHNLLGLVDVGEDKIETTSRPNKQSGTNVEKEAIVVFKEVETRDSVIGASSKLGNCINDNGQPKAGIRLEIPPSLKSDFNTLRRFGQLLRSRHGQGTRRHVKFEDSDRSLFLNVKLPGDKRWSRVNLEFAKRSLNSRQQLDSQEMESRFDLNGPIAAPNSRPRMASMSNPPTQAAPQWTGRRSESVSS